jgi:hypothetical protein
MLAYAAASLVHHLHNAAYLTDYPNMPASVSPLGIYAAWSGTTLLGTMGYVFICRRKVLFGSALLCAYAGYGLDSLVHYSLAPFSAHTYAMNATIWLEVLTTTLVLATTFPLLWQSLRHHPG